MLLTAEPLMRAAATTQRRLAVVPRGFDVQLRLSYHDTLGRRFHAVRSQLALRPSRLDLIRVTVDVDNCSLVLHADKIGQTVVHFYDEAPDHPALVDYLRVDVADVLRPSQARLVVGDVVCFATDVRSVGGASGRWSTDSKTLAVDAETGLALALAVGDAQIIYSIDNAGQHQQVQTTSTAASVAAIASLHFVAGAAEKFITNGRSAGLHQHAFPVALGAGRTGGNLVGDNCSEQAVTEFLLQQRAPPPVTCRLSFSVQQADTSIEELLSARAEFNAKTGLYQCVVRSVGQPAAANSVLDTDVVVSARHQLGVDIAAHLTVPYHPAVFVQTLELHVSDTQPVAHLIVTGKHSVLQVHNRLLCSLKV